MVLSFSEPVIIDGDQVAAVIPGPSFGSSCRHGVSAEKVAVACERIADERVIGEACR